MVMFAPNQEGAGMPVLLLLEDNPSLLTVLRETVELTGYQAATARNGIEGLAVLRGSSALPDAILCDVLMPEMDGLAFLRQLRATPHWAHLFVIAMSGARDEGIQAVAAGANAYLVKPFSLAELRQLLPAAH
jgi:CheY-like chemotaxis protein